MATKKEKKVTDEKVEKKVLTAEEKAAKRKARMEALKNRPEGQRPNGKQMDVIQISEKSEVRKYASVVKVKGKSLGCLITTVGLVNGEVVSVAEEFVPGDLTVKSKKGHGTLTGQKHKKAKDEDDDTEDEEEGDED